MLLNIAAVAVILIILLAIGIFVGKTLTMNPADTSGHDATTSPDNSSYVITLPSTSPDESSTASPGTSMAPTPSSSPSSGASTTTLTPTPAATTSASPTATPVASATTSPSVTPSPTAVPSQTPTPSPSPSLPASPTPEPGQMLLDAPYYEHITPLKSGDESRLQPVHNSAIMGNDTIYVDIYNSNMGSSYAYPGDTIGIGLKVINSGPAIDTSARANISISQIIYNSNDIPTTVLLFSKDYYTRLTIGDNSYTFKNISYTVPTNIPASMQYTVYQVKVQYYVSDELMSGAIKEVNIL